MNNLDQHRNFTYLIFISDIVSLSLIFEGHWFIIVQQTHFCQIFVRRTWYYRLMSFCQAQIVSDSDQCWSEHHQRLQSCLQSCRLLQQRLPSWVALCSVNVKAADTDHCLVCPGANASIPVWHLTKPTVDWNDFDL